MAADNNKPPLKRIKRKIKRPNPLFEQWITEARDEAKEKGWNSVFNYSKALTSLKQFPLVLNSGKECKLLKNFGEGMCIMLDRKLAAYKAANPSAIPDSPSIPAAADPVPAKKKRSAPKKKAAATSTDVNQASTSNNNASTSASHNNGTSAPPPAKARKAAPNKADTVPDLPPVHIYIPAGAAEIKLLVDTGETSNGSLKNVSKRATMKELQAQNIPFEIRNLNVGDFMWIASYDGHELVLPYIIERKRVDDLSKSIKDGRYKEQKARLKATGLNVIYLIEVVQCPMSLPLETLCQAEINTEVHDKFCVHRTTGAKDTVSYLATMTAVMRNKFKNKILENCLGDQEPMYLLTEPTLYLYPFKEFNNGSAKLENFTVREMFALHLLQVSGASPDAVCAIVEEHSTPALLRQAFAKCSSDSQCLEVLTSLKFGPLKRSLPQEVARKIWRFYMTPDFSLLPSNT